MAVDLLNVLSDGSSEWMMCWFKLTWNSTIFINFRKNVHCPMKYRSTYSKWQKTIPNLVLQTHISNRHPSPIFEWGDSTNSDIGRMEKRSFWVRFLLKLIDFPFNPPKVNRFQKKSEPKRYFFHAAAITACQNSDRTAKIQSNRKQFRWKTRARIIERSNLSILVMFPHTGRLLD